MRKKILIIFSFFIVFSLALIFFVYSGWKKLTSQPASLTEALLETAKRPSPAELRMQEIAREHQNETLERNPLKESFAPLKSSPVYHVTAAFLYDKELSPDLKLQNLRHLSRNLDKYEIEALYSFLLTAPADPLNAELKNEIMNLLRKQTNIPESLPALLALMSEDKNIDITSRVYAVQHMAPLLESMNDENALLRNALDKALVSSSPELAVTALLAADSMSSKYSSAKDMTDKAIPLLLGRTDIPSSMKASLLQVCSGKNNPDAQALARASLPDTSVSAALRLSSIALLATEGAPEDLSALEEIMNSGNPSYCFKAAENAIKNIKNRQHTN